jgi:hypothetical protein
MYFLKCLPTYPFVVVLAPCAFHQFLLLAEISKQPNANAATGLGQSPFAIRPKIFAQPQVSTHQSYPTLTKCFPTTQADRTLGGRCAAAGFAYPQPAGSHRQHPDFEAGTKGWGQDGGAFCFGDMMLGCTVASGCQEQACTFGQYAGHALRQVEPVLDTFGFPVYRNNAADVSANGNTAVGRHSIHNADSFYSW